MGNNPVMYVDPDGEFAIIAGLIIKKAIMAAKVAKVAKVAGATAKVAKAAKVKTFSAKGIMSHAKSGAINTLSSYDSEDGLGWHTVGDFAAGAVGSMAGVEMGSKGIGTFVGGTLNAAFDGAGFDYEGAQSFIGGALSVYAGMGKVVKGKTLFDKTGTGEGLLKQQKSNIFANTLHKHGDAFLKYGFQASAYDFAYSKQEDFLDRGWGHLGIFAVGGTMGAVADQFFINQNSNMNDFWRSTIGAGSYTAEWFISARIKNLPKDGFKWGGSSRNKSWILGGKWIEGTLNLFGQ
jgi:hypothetical protein